MRGAGAGERDREERDEKKDEYARHWMKIEGLSYVGDIEKWNSKEDNHKK